MQTDTTIKTIVTFAAAETTPSAIAASSTDGISWTQRSLPTNASWSSVTVNQTTGVFVAISGDYNYSSIAASSTDGITWTTTTVPTSTSNYRMVYGNGIFVLTQQTNATASYTTDGITWTTTNIINSSNKLYSSDAMVALIYKSTNSSEVVLSGCVFFAISLNASISSCFAFNSIKSVC